MRSILLTTLEDYGFRDVTLNLLKNYFTDRNQFVKINNTLSETHQVKFGVPQGIVLGLMLFLIYINNLLTNVSKGRISSFTDDAVIMYEAEY